MLSALITGIVLGVSSGLTPGPLLTLVITQTLRHNMKEGIKVAMAPLVTDLPIILVSLLLLSRLSNINWILGSISTAGGLYILYLAYESFRAGPVDFQLNDVNPQSLKKGSIVNLLNPAPYLFWVTVGAPLMFKLWAQGHAAPFAFIVCFYVMLIMIKILLAAIVGKSRHFLSGRIYLFIMRGMGAVLALFALFLLKDAVHLLGLFS